MEQLFIRALQENSLETLQNIPKSDLHNHAGRGGTIRYIEEWAQVKIEPLSQPFETLAQMQDWFEVNVKCHCPGTHGYLKRIEAAFAQAEKDRINVLALSFGMGEIDLLGGMDSFTKMIDSLRRQYAPHSKFYPELALGRESGINAILDRLDEILTVGWFKSIDICNNEFAQPIQHFKPVYKKAKEAGLRLKAHVGEFGSADDVMEAVEALELQEVHHGIAAAQSVQVMNWLAAHRIRLNVCPTSNVMLKVVENYSSHPIRRLYDYSIPVTINTDDLLIFNQSVSREYLNLYQSKLMTADELNDIRETGLCYWQLGD